MLPNQQNNYCSFLILAIATISIFMISIDMAIVGSSIPTIAVALNLSLDRAANILLAYYLALSSTIILFGKISDNIGVLKIFVWGCIFFILGTLGAGIAPNFSTLICFRFIQGLGGAILLPIHATLISRFFICKHTGKFFGIITFFTGAGYALGFILGGIICKYFSWRWIFFINIPLGIIALFCVDLIDKKYNGENQNATSIDYYGAALIISALALLTFLLQQLNTLNFATKLIISGVIILLILLFILRSKNHPYPLLKLSMFKNYYIMLPIVIAILVNIIFNGFSFINPFYLNSIKKLSSENSGFILATLPVASMLIGPFAGYCCDKFGALTTSVFSAFLLISATFLFYFLSPTSSISYIICALTILGVSIAIFFTANIKLAMDHAKDDERGIISAFKACTSYFGGVIGFALFAQMLSGFDSPQAFTTIPATTLMGNFKNSCILGVVLAVIILLFSLKQKIAGTDTTSSR